jgi:hypothetical protein
VADLKIATNFVTLSIAGEARKCGALVSPSLNGYIPSMDIASASMISSQANVLDQVGITMLSKSLKGSQQQAADLLKGLGSPAPLPEGFGQHVDIFR